MGAEVSIFILPLHGWVAITSGAELSCAHFVSSMCQQLSCPPSYPSLSAWLVRLKHVVSISVPVQWQASLCHTSPEKKCWTDGPQLGCKPPQGFCLLESFPSPPCSREDVESIISKWEKMKLKNSISPFLLSHTSLRLQPYENVKLNSSSPPSSQLSLSMINALLCYRGEENPPVFWCLLLLRQPGS